MLRSDTPRWIRLEAFSAEVTRNLPSLTHSLSDFEDRNRVFPLVFRGKMDRLIERVNPTAFPAHRGDYLPCSPGRALCPLSARQTRELAQLLTDRSRRQTGQHPVGGPAPRPCVGESAGTSQGYKREPRDPGTESPVGVTKDEAENAPRLKVLYGEDSKESKPPISSPSRDTHRQSLR